MVWLPGAMWIDAGGLAEYTNNDANASCCGARQKCWKCTDDFQEGLVQHAAIPCGVVNTVHEDRASSHKDKVKQPQYLEDG